MSYTAESLLAALLEALPRQTAEAPKDARGLYGLVDHLGDLRYIGSTSSTRQSLYERIHQRHRTGSEDLSHYFSRMYNTGRMWRDRKDPTTKSDGDVAKRLRNSFIADHCRAVWVTLPDSAEITRLEAAVIAIAPTDTVAWNHRRMEVYAEPVGLVDDTIRRLGLGPAEIAAIEKQCERFAGTSEVIAQSIVHSVPQSASTPVTPFPEGPFRFFALDVETANNHRGSICQIGVACVRPDNSIETWVTLVNPETRVWVWSDLHGITIDMVQHSPTFADVLPVLEAALRGSIVYQHSGFDRTAIAAACADIDVMAPSWRWQNSVQVARAAWPELKGNGGHGLASLKAHLGLLFNHHDAGEDARAAAEVVLRAKSVQAATAGVATGGDISQAPSPVAMTPVMATHLEQAVTEQRHIGKSQLTPANLKNNHIYLRNFFQHFPADAIGGSNMAEAATREIHVDWGGGMITTDLDGTKKLFRKRAWVKTFFETSGAQAGDWISVSEIAPYSYRLFREPSVTTD